MEVVGSFFLKLFYRSVVVGAELNVLLREYQVFQFEHFDKADKNVCTECHDRQNSITRLTM